MSFELWCRIFVDQRSRADAAEAAVASRPSNVARKATRTWG
jgi:hypothetical protein